MELYKEHNVNPFGSCLPLLVQAPVFIALNATLRYHIHASSDRGFLGMKDIFIPLSQVGTIAEYSLIVLYVGSMLASTLLFSFVQDRQQKYMLAAMPIVFVPFVLRFSTGVMIYWITSNFWTLGQQGIIKRTMGHRFPGGGGSSAKTVEKGGGGGGKGDGGGKAAAPPGGAPRPARGSGRRSSQQPGRRAGQRRGGRKR
jgi:YidC/Oxa1 family membrane protein insertase